MAMQMGFRWYGEGNDKISLSDIRQIPGVSTIVWALHDKMPGEVWQPEEIDKVVSQIKAAGFNADVVESVNVHDDIKIGLPTRDKYIENYIQTIRNLAPFGVKVICYNFMPIFDWTRSDLPWLVFLDANDLGLRDADYRDMKRYVRRGLSQYIILT